MFHKIFPALVLLFIIAGCQTNTDRKIKLSTRDSVSSGQAQSVSTVLQVNPEQQRSVAIVLFRNETGKKSLDWLQRGLTDMLTSDLKQSPYLNVYSTSRILEIAKQSGKSDEILKQPEELDELARNAKIDVVLAGRYYQQGKNLYIDVEMRDVRAAKIMYVKSVEGESLEKIFSMVDELSSRVRENLRSETRGGIDSSVNLTQMTNSIEAFRYYSKGLEYQDKLFVNDAARSFMDAIRLDSTFAAAYLRLALLNQRMTDKDELFNLIDKAEKYQDKLSESDRFRLKILETNQKNNYEDALALLREAVEKYPNVVEFHNDLANYYHFVLMDVDDALAQYEIARELDPNQKLLYNNLGYLYAERGDFQTALSYFEKYRELAPDEPNPLDSKAEILIRAGKFDEAESELKTVVERWPNFSYSAIRLSNLYRELGNYQKALAYSEKIKASDVEL
jgi:Tfp pilus assembly protein PilF/TolB-like protein